jgi:putative RNA 2'-phosphotransferase
MTPKNDRKASKFLSLILRHKPQTVGLALDRYGYVSVEALLSALNEHGWEGFNKEDLDRVVSTNNKKRFAYSSDAKYIRASQGHSIEVDLELTPTEPPAKLFHGTVKKFIPAIKSEGLQSQSRQHVHLSKDRETATNVGQRRGKPLILEIDAKAMHQAGYSFFISANEVWLAEEVPIQFITFP